MQGELRIIVLKDRMIQEKSRPWVSFLLHSLTSCIISEVNARLPFPKIGKFLRNRNWIIFDKENHSKPTLMGNKLLRWLYLLGMLPS